MKDKTTIDLINEDDNDPAFLLSSVRIGGAGNYYGGLHVVKYGRGYYWSIENYNGHYWEKIPTSLYNECVKFNESLKKQRRTK